LKNKTIYLLRHGETDYNKNGMVQGRGINASLNDEGRSQARTVTNALNSIRFDQIYTSALVRTQETVQGFIEKGIPMKSLAGFDEISWGNQEGVQASIEEKTFYANTVAEWRKGNLNVNVGGGETPIEVMQRQKDAMKEVLNSEDEMILICMHGRAMRILLCWLLNYPLNYMDGFPHQNCAYYKLEYRNDTFLVTNFNEVQHL
jgi:broad specificity phosphatase PhoE